jgi:hypothetical protein
MSGFLGLFVRLVKLSEMALVYSSNKSIIPAESKFLLGLQDVKRGVGHS